MNDAAAALTLVAFGTCLGLLSAGTAYARELRRMARFLRGRNHHSNARLTRGAGAPGLLELTDAVNAQLDQVDEERVEALRHQQEFQRDLSALSHDIRTPLMGAKGYLQLATEEPGTAARDARLSAAAGRIDGTIALLDQLFAYTKASDPDLALNPRPVALMPLLAEVLVGRYPEFETRGWEPEVRIGNEAVLVEADEDALRRILENLVGNALRHGAGALRIRDVSTRDANSLVLEFANEVNEPGAIDPDRLFERFYQADDARGHGGAGLGLSVAAKLAGAMGAAISARVDSRDLIVTLALPLAP